MDVRQRQPVGILDLLKPLGVRTALQGGGKRRVRGAMPGMKRGNLK
jgi:hypothetical protein